MQADWIAGLAGGLLIGTAGALFLLLNGRIMGASGLIGGLIDGSGRSDAAERGVFLLGLASVPLFLSLIFGPETTHLTDNIGLLLAAGLLVGVGTRLANGCTSGHGVCGMSRLAPRGIIATLIYIGAGVVTVALMRFVFGGL